MSILKSTKSGIDSKIGWHFVLRDKSKKIFDMLSINEKNVNVRFDFNYPTFFISSSGKRRISITDGVMWFCNNEPMTVEKIERCIKEHFESCLKDNSIPGYYFEMEYIDWKFTKIRYWL